MALPQPSSWPEPGVNGIPPCAPFVILNKRTKKCNTETEDEHRRHLWAVLNYLLQVFRDAGRAAGADGEYDTQECSQAYWVAHGWLPRDAVAMYDKRKKTNRHRRILLDLRLLADLLNLDLPYHLRETKVKTEVTGGTRKSISHVTNDASERLSATSAPPMPEQVASAHASPTTVRVADRVRLCSAC